MDTNYNRIKVADLEKNQPDKILSTNSTGELVFTDINEISIDNYNALDFTNAGKALDARQGKVLKDLIDTGLKPQITINTGVNNITTDTLDANGLQQQGRNVIINNGVNPISITVKGGIINIITYTKFGTGEISFVQGEGRTLTQVDGTAILNGVVGSTATLVSIGTIDLLRISNA